MNELAAALAHELNQPLTGILSNAQAAQRLLALHPPDLGEASDALADIVADNKRAGEIIRRARALLKRDSSTREPVDMNALIRGVLEIVHSELVMNDVGVETNLGEALPPVVGDPVQLQQVMINLVMNAAQAVSTQPAVQRKVWIATARDSGDQTRVSVRDFGPGISKEQASVLFEPLYTTRKDGLGLGLPICRTIITAHRGQIWAENSPGGGLIVSFTLPSKEENPNG
jgi:two-component system sensor kinase FixL